MGDSLSYLDNLLSTGISQKAYRVAVRNESQIDWHCAACAGLGSSELDPVVPDSPPSSSPQPASPTPASPAAPSTPSSPLPASPTLTTVPPIAVELSLEDPDPAPA